MRGEASAGSNIGAGECAGLRRPCLVDSSRCVAKPRAPSTLLEQLFDAELRARRLHDELGRAKERELLAAVDPALAAVRTLDDDVAEAHLVCLARLLGERQSPAAVDRLLDVLGAEQAGARLEAGEQLLGLADERFELLAAAVERALARLPEQSPAAVELCYLLAESRQEGTAELVQSLLHHRRADVVAAAIDALLTIGDPAAITALRGLIDDPRPCAIVTSDDEPLEATVGELAQQAIELLSAVQKLAAEPPVSGAS